MDSFPTNIPVTKSVKLSAGRAYFVLRAISKNDMKIRFLKFCLNLNIPSSLEKLEENRESRQIRRILSVE